MLSQILIKIPSRDLDNASAISPLSHGYQTDLSLLHVTQLLEASKIAYLSVLSPNELIGFIEGMG